MNSEIDRISELAEAGERMIERLRKKAFLPEARKGLLARYGIAEAAALLGCSTNRIRMAEEDGRLPPPPPTENGRRPGYTIEQLLVMRDVLGASPARAPLDVPAMIAVQNFKGGVGKSTVTTHLAHYFGVQGYRVLVVDCDSQATTTTLFGFNPHFNVTREQTLYPYLSIDPTQSTLDLRGAGHALAQCRPDPLQPRTVRRGVRAGRRRIGWRIGAGEPFSQT